MPKAKNDPLCRVGDTILIDLTTGEETPVEGGGLRLLPAPPGTCGWCHVEHDPDQPHDRESLAYQMRFHARHGRWPTWSDAMAHCRPEVRAFWRQALVSLMREKGMDVPADLGGPA